MCIRDSCTCVSSDNLDRSTDNRATIFRSSNFTRDLTLCKSHARATVSYTHLDVYKRQAKDKNGKVIKECNFTDVHLVKGKQTCYEGNFFDNTSSSSFTVSGCLLYTSKFCGTDIVLIHEILLNLEIRYKDTSFYR